MTDRMPYLARVSLSRAQSNATKEAPVSTTNHLRVAFVTGLAAAGLFAAEASAQTYPTKPIRVIDAYPPGGGTDIVARTISPKFQESLGHPWIIDSRAGAQGIIGAEIASKAAADGYTLLMYTTNFTSIRASTRIFRTI